MIFRQATIEDLLLLQHWDEQPHVVSSDPNDDWEWETELLRRPEWREQLIAESNTRPIGFLQIIDPHYEDSHYWGAISKGFRAIDIWIGEASDLGKGYGTKMMSMAIKRCFSNSDVSAILVDPLTTNTRAIAFYRKLGFTFIERRNFGDDDCSVFKLKRCEA